MYHGLDFFLIKAKPLPSLPLKKKTRIMPNTNVFTFVFTK